MLSCREVARLVATGEVAEVGWLRRLRVRLHLLTCDHCQRYARELRAIGTAARRLMTGDPADPSRLARLEQSILTRLRAEERKPPTPPDSAKGRV